MSLLSLLKNLLDKLDRGTGRDVFHDNLGKEGKVGNGVE